MNPNNGDKTKPDISPWDIFKSDAISFLFKNNKVFQFNDLKSKFLSRMAKMNSNNGNDTKSDIFPKGTFKSDVIFYWLQNNNIFQFLL